MATSDERYQGILSILQKAGAKAVSEPDAVKAAQKIIDSPMDYWTNQGFSEEDVNKYKQELADVRDNIGEHLPKLQEAWGPVEGEERVPFYPKEEVSPSFDEIPDETLLGPVTETPNIAGVPDYAEYGAPEGWEQPKAPTQDVLKQFEEPPAEEAVDPNATRYDGNFAEKTVKMTPGAETEVAFDEEPIQGFRGVPYALPPELQDDEVLQKYPEFPQQTGEGLAKVANNYDDTVTKFDKKGRQEVKTRGVPDTVAASSEKLFTTAARDLLKPQKDDRLDVLDRYKNELNDIEQKEFKQALIKGIGQIASGLAGFAGPARVGGRVSPVAKYFKYTPKDYSVEKKAIADILKKGDQDPRFNRIVELLKTSPAFAKIGDERKGISEVNLEGRPTWFTKWLEDQAALDRATKEKAAKEGSPLVTVNTGEKKTTIDEERTKLPETWDKFSSRLTVVPLPFDPDDSVEKKKKEFVSRVRNAQHEAQTGSFSSIILSLGEALIDANPSISSADFNRQMDEAIASPDVTNMVRDISSSKGKTLKSERDQKVQEKKDSAPPPKVEAPANAPTSTPKVEPTKPNYGKVEIPGGNTYVTLRFEDPNQKGESIYKVNMGDKGMQTIGYGHKLYKTIKNLYKGK